MKTDSKVGLLISFNVTLRMHY